jgi:hypothetical protein
MLSARDACDWKLLLRIGREWQQSHPADANGPFAEAIGAYFLGDMPTAMAAWQKSKRLNSDFSPNADKWLRNAYYVHKNFPTLQLQQLTLDGADAWEESQVWWDKARTLLAKHQYEEIEKVAVTLQKSNAANIKGTPFLETFFSGLASGGSGKGTPQQRIAAWRHAKPNSTLARLAEIQIWTDAAWKARGKDVASSITPAMQKRIDQCVGRASQLIRSLPAPAKQSPLTFVSLMKWGQFTGDRAFLDQTFADAVRKHPNYNGLYTMRAYLLLPRWYGNPGEWEELVAGRANRLGGERGDIFYARIFADGIAVSGDIFPETGASYARVQRGLFGLQKRRPASVSVFTAQLRAASSAKEWKLAQAMLLSPKGNHLDVTAGPLTPFMWHTWRLQVLAQQVTQ